MAPVLFQSLPTVLGLAATVVFLQIGILLFASGRRHFRWVSIAFVGIVCGVTAGGVAAGPLHSPQWLLFVLGVAGGTALGYFLRPAGVGLALAFVGATVASHAISIPAAQLFVAVDLFAYGLLLTDLAPMVVSGMLASSVVLIVILSVGVPGPAALVIASAAGAARVMGSALPPRFESRGQRGLPEMR